MLAPAMFGISLLRNTRRPGQEDCGRRRTCGQTQIQVMLKILLRKPSPRSADAADALAIAITHAITARAPRCG